MAETIEVTLGEENFIIHPYSGFKVGPIRITTILREGESYQDAYDRVWPQLEAMANQMFLARRNQYAEHYLARN